MVYRISSIRHKSQKGSPLKGLMLAEFLSKYFYVLHIVGNRTGKKKVLRSKFSKDNGNGE